MARKMKTMDGNNAAAHVSYAFTDVAGIYPITPSSVMAEMTDKWAAEGRVNVFGQKVKVVEMQSEAGAAGTVHGSLAAGALTTTYTASQGLLLMIPNMYKIAGEQLPGVIHCSARALASHALSIFGDHSDVMACRQTGFAMLCASNVQEVMDLGAVAHLSAIKGKVPFLHFFDGFRTSHELQKIEIWDYEDLKDMLDMDAVNEFRKNALNPEHPVLRGSAQNPDVFFQAREACNKYYDALPAVVEEYMDKVNAKIGTDYKPFNYYGADDAEYVIVAMGSVNDTIEETVDYLNANGAKVGLVKVRLYRPWSTKHLLSVLPKSVKKIAVLDRTKEPGALGEPLYLDVVTALAGTEFKDVQVVGGRYGLGSKDTTPGCIAAVYENLKAAEPKNNFSIGIVDDVTNLSLPTVDIHTAPEGTISCKFWGLGSDGTVGANKNSIKIIGDHTDKYAQAYFAYDSKKSGGVTISHLRFGDTPIKSTYFISKADFVACHNPSYIDKYDMVSEVKKGGSFLLNCPWSVEELEDRLPATVKKYLADNDINFYIIDGIKIGREIGLGGRINTVLQSAFFKIAQVIPEAEAIQYMKDAATYSYSKKGQHIVDMNHQAIEAGANNIVKVEIPASWKNAVAEETKVSVDCDRADLKEYVENILIPINAQKGDSLPVSAFEKYVDGHMEQGAAAFEKRGIAVDVPQWIPENCIECNQCSLVCPHAVIRPFVLNAEEVAKAPEGMKTKKMMGKGLDHLTFTMGVSVLDCTGCGSCAAVCPAKNKALVMSGLDSQIGEQKYFNYNYKNVEEKPEVNEVFKVETVKGSQFKTPLLEYSGACAGCGETPYAKLMTQLFGDRMYISNATGCSSIWGGSSPSTPYTVDKKGHGPAWANSLFEDNAEHGLGMFLGATQLREKVTAEIEELYSFTTIDSLKAAIDEWKATYNDTKTNTAATEKLVAELEKVDCCEKGKAAAASILAQKDFIAKKSIWILGGDGWAYDIGFGGLDHVIASNEDVNILVFDTEVYSNTGGQASKSTPSGSIAQFAAAGKVTKKKDLGAIARSYGYVYVAQVSMGADYNQCVKAFAEAEAYHGPSIIIAYAPCINHGIKGGMGTSMEESKKAVQSGYWQLYRFNPDLAAEGKNPLTYDSKEPTIAYRDFIMNEVRYNALSRANPERAEVLFSAGEKAATEKRENLKKLSEM
ncbi:MAG: pyruvate:ferredoxin (flavodoxin) oxidoreductase [Clostridia bacterium]|nr:pyruvate:ferredoxin (flavodoxin) oxidoreductase [Clostridia bacterium]